MFPDLFPSTQATKAPRMLGWAGATLALVSLALLMQYLWPGTVLAVTAYKGHLMALGGWGGYWLDRALFPYDRPHAYLDLADEPRDAAEGAMEAVLVASNAFGAAMLRRAIVVAACLICVGLGA